MRGPSVFFLYIIIIIIILLIIKVIKVKNLKSTNGASLVVTRSKRVTVSGVLCKIV
jgi:hypothetical protein